MSMNKSTMVQELIGYYSNGNKAHFANILGVKPQTINSWISRNTFDAELIYAKCIGVSAEWLMKGEGPMINSSKNFEKTISDTSIIETRPRIPFEAAAGSLSLITQSVTMSQCDQLPVIPRLPKYDFTIIVKGDSMEPEFKSGDELACRMLRESSYIQWGRPYVVDSIDGVVLKRIHDAGDKILCTSDNPRYGEFVIPKTEINHLAIVVGIIRLL